MNSNVSVVIPYYNAAQTLLRALESISKQTRQALEIIIVNDGSNFDELKIIVDEWGGVAKVVDLNGNYGAAYARNVGVSESVGKFVAFLDSDDIWHPDKLELQEELMIRTNAFFSCHGYVFDLKKNKFNSCSKGIKKISLYSFLFRNPVFTPTVMVKKSGLIPFDVRLTRSEDLKCWVSNLSHGNFLYMKVDLAGGYKKAVGESGLSASFIKMHREYKAAWDLLYSDGFVTFSLCILAKSIENIKYPLRRLLR